MTENDAPEADPTLPSSAPQAGRPSDATLADLPAKVRVHALARLLGSSSRAVLTVLARLDVGARSAQSSIDRETVARVVDDFFPTAPVAAVEVVPASPPPTVLDPPREEAAPTPTAPDSETAAGSGPTPRRRATRRAAPAPTFLAPGVETPAASVTPATPDDDTPAPDEDASAASGGDGGSGRNRRRRGSRSGGVVTPDPDAAAPDAEVPDASATGDDAAVAGAVSAGPDSSDAPDDDDDDTDGEGRRRRRRGRRGRGRGRGPSDDAEGTSDDETSDDDEDEGEDTADTAEGEDTGSSDASETDDSSASGSRRRRRRRRRGSDGDSDSSDVPDDPPNTVTHVREKAEREKAEKSDRSDRSDDSGRRHSGDDEVRGVKGSTRLEAKRQRRRDGRDQGRRRPAILSESEFLARRESVERTMIVRQLADRSQIAVLEDGVLVEHFVAGHGQNSSVGNVYLGRVQNVLPSMEAAFVDIGRGRNAVLYAGEVNWDASGLEGRQRKIEQALSSGDSVLVQVTKDTVGHKGARLTTQISLPGRFLVYVPAGGATGISRKLPEQERKRLKDILKRIVPDESGVIIRTAAEGVEETELNGDVRRLQAQWEAIEHTADQSSTKAPSLVHEEPDLLIRVVRDMFNEDFSSLVVSGEQAWETIEGYVTHVAPDLAPRLERHVGPEDVFTAYRVDEQLIKALDRKVWLPSGGTLVIDRTEAMTVVDVNTGKFTGSGGNLEETVTRNNLEAAEEIVRQLRLRDIGGMIVIDFIDMVLESNRDLVLRRLTECLGRDRTRHQVSEVTSLGLVQMTRKRVGQGLLDEFSTPCEHCKGRGVVVHPEAVIESGAGRGRGSGRNGSGGPADVAAQIGQSGSAQSGSAAQDGSDGSDGSGSGGGGRRRGRGRRSARSDGGPPAPAEGVGTTPDDTTPEVADETVDETVADETVAASPTLLVEESPDMPEPVGAPDGIEVIIEGRRRTRGRRSARSGGTLPADEPEVAVETAPADEADEADAVVDNAEVEPEVTLEADLAEQSAGTAPDDNVAPAALAVNDDADTEVPPGEVPPTEAPAPRRRRRAASRPAGPPVGGASKDVPASPEAAGVGG